MSVAPTMSAAAPFSEGCNTLSPLFGFVVPGEPVAWARARGGSEFGGFYTPKRQRAFKKTVGDYCRIAMLQARVKLIERPHAARLAVRVFLEPPKTWQASRDLAKRAEWARAQTYAECIEKPDLDNWLKLPMDAMSGLAWADDEQVVSFPNSGKWWDPRRPRLEVEVWQVAR